MASAGHKEKGGEHSSVPVIAASQHPAWSRSARTNQLDGKVDTKQRLSGGAAGLHPLLPVLLLPLLPLLLRMPKIGIMSHKRSPGRDQLGLGLRQPLPLQGPHRSPLVARQT
jgi:hypothetical protein